MNTAGLSRSSSRTWGQTLGDLLDASPLEARAFVLDESVTNLREVIHGVAALLTPFARCRELRLRARIDQSVAETILADGARLGQLVFHLLNRTIQLSAQGEISLIVRAQPLNSGSQRIFISVVDAVVKCAPDALPPLFDPAIEDPYVAKWLADADACLPLCRILAQRMRGELSVTSGTEKGPRAIFNAPFGVERWAPSAKTARGSVQMPLFSSATQSGEVSASASFEPFDSHYLDALSEEGVDLQAFLSNWRDAMNEDLGRLSGLLREGQHDHLHGVLHRLSGAVGLVGASGLMEALRRASKSPHKRGATSVDTLLARAKILVVQLEAAARAYRSPSR
ncbi:histidine kinase [Burkholderia sp. Ch1-1]|uniref:sensor histidine kinase n=1 Tax=Paraburkholderia sp. USG1 TaxID=2952268 RepID=UPI0001D25C96|nr:ATP-binding protein [Paraburkholderia sp. USG1]EIF35548.1 histidine kinase [Burkholderia sp. Ch1-1]MDR8397410.1 sensor histidine kinase [Paraburkholderia sp. USG1]